MNAKPFVDAAGRQVIDFAATCRTLGKVGELADNIMRMAESGAWRHYRTAVGDTTWRECELDYFLISCDLEYDDVYRAIKWNKLGDATRAMMDHDVSPDKRRPLEEAAAAYRAAGPETLLERAERLRWMTKTGKPRSPLSDRQRVKQASGGKTVEQQAQERRQQRIAAPRRRELDRVAEEMLAALAGDDERRYLLDTMAKLLNRKAGRPKDDHEQWAKDVAELNGDTKALAERWSVPLRTAQHRTQEIRGLVARGRRRPFQREAMRG
jgi:hypothetical protein